MLVIKELIGNAMMLFFYIIAIYYLLCIASDLTRKYKNIKRKAKKYDLLIKKGVLLR